MSLHSYYRLISKKRMLPHIALVCIALLSIAFKAWSPIFTDVLFPKGFLPETVLPGELFPPYVFSVSNFFQLTAPLVGVLSCILGLYVIPALRIHQPRHQTIQKKHYTIIFFIILILAIILRLFAMRPDLLAVDAMYHLQAAQQLIEGNMPEYTRAFLYTLIIACAQKIFGQAPVVAMYANLCIQICTLIFIYCVGKKFFSEKIALVALVLIGLSPWSILMSSYIRMYEMLQLLVLVTISIAYYIIFYTKKTIFSERREALKQVVWCVLFVLSAVAMIHIHVLALGVLVAICLALWIYMVWNIGVRIYTQNWTLLRDDGSIIYGLLALLSVGIVLVFVPESIAYARLAFSLDMSVREIFLSVGGYYQFISQQITQPFFFFLIGLSAAASVVFLKRYPHFFFFTAVGVLVCVQFIFFDRYFSPRYSYHVLPILIIIFSFSIWWLYYILINSLTLFMRMSKRGKQIFFVIYTIAIMYSMPIDTLFAVYKQPAYGQNDVHEIFYPYEQAIQSIDITPEDYLFSYNLGIWDVMQDASRHIHPVYMQTIQGAVKKKAEVASVFFDNISNAKHGWFLADTYRHKRWNCTLPEMPDCSIRNFINTAFMTKPEYIHGNLQLYEWKPYFFETEKNIGSKFSNFSNGVHLGKYAWLGKLDIQKESEESGLTVTHRVRSLKKNTHGAFLIIRPIARFADGSTVAFDQSVMYIPKSTKARKQYTYSYEYRSQDHTDLQLRDAEAIVVEYSIFDFKKSYESVQKDRVRVYKK